MRRTLTFLDRKIDQLNAKFREEKDEMVKNEMHIISRFRDEIREKIWQERMSASPTGIATSDEIVWIFEDLNLDYRSPTPEIVALCTYIKQLRAKLPTEE